MDEGGSAQNGKRRDEIERASREALFLGATFEIDGHAATGRIRNVSESGALLETPLDLSIGAALIISFRGHDRRSATVKRRTAKGYGIQFEHPIDPASCKQPVSPAAAKGNEFLLNLREGHRKPIWDTSGSTFKRPGTKT